MEEKKKEKKPIQISLQGAILIALIIIILIEIIGLGLRIYTIKNEQKKAIPEQEVGTSMTTAWKKV